MTETTQFISKSDAAAACGCSESTVQRWCHRSGVKHRYNPNTKELEVSVADLVEQGRLPLEAAGRVRSLAAQAREDGELAELRIERAALVARLEELNARVAHLTSHLGFMEALARKAGLV